MKKQTLKEEFEKFFDDYPSINGCPPDRERVWNFFEPHLKKVTSKAPLIEIPEDKIQEYVELFPAIKLPTGKYARNNVRDLLSGFQWYFKNYPQYADWNIILKVTQNYLEVKEQDNWNFCRTSLYFVRKMNQDKTYVSDLADYYERFVKGDTQENRSFHQEKVV